MNVEQVTANIAKGIGGLLRKALPEGFVVVFCVLPVPKDDDPEEVFYVSGSYPGLSLEAVRGVFKFVGEQMKVDDECDALTKKLLGPQH